MLSAILRDKDRYVKHFFAQEVDHCVSSYSPCRKTHTEHRDFPYKFLCVLSALRGKRFGPILVAIPFAYMRTCNVFASTFTPFVYSSSEICSSGL